MSGAVGNSATGGVDGYCRQRLGFPATQPPGGGGDAIDVEAELAE